MTARAVFETVEQTAARWECTGARVRQLAAEGKIPGAFKVGLAWLIPASAQRPKVSREAGPGRGRRGPQGPERRRTRRVKQGKRSASKAAGAQRKTG